MEFDKSKVYTSVNADELKVGSKVVCDDNLYALKFCVEEETDMTTIKEVLPEGYMLRFRTGDGSVHALAYLVSEPEEKKLKVSDLKLGDIVRHKSGNLEYLVTGIDHSENEVFFGDDWSDDTDLINWEKVEK
jgi:hypothetical protein